MLYTVCIFQPIPVVILDNCINIYGIIREVGDGAGGGGQKLAVAVFNYDLVACKVGLQYYNKKSLFHATHPSGYSLEM